MNSHRLLPAAPVKPEGAAKPEGATATKDESTA